MRSSCSSVRIPELLFLACEDSSYMAGQVLHPNGGEPVAG
jgi:hypothetical protein